MEGVKDVECVSQGVLNRMAELYKEAFRLVTVRVLPWLYVDPFSSYGVKVYTVYDRHTLFCLFRSFPCR